MGGDFNMVMDKNLDTMNYKNLNNPKARSELITLIRVSFSKYHLPKKKYFTNYQ